MDALVDAVSFLRYFNYMQAASMTLLILDYMETFPLEVAFFWKRKRDHLKLLYFITRYFIFAHYVISFVHYNSKLIPVSACNSWYISSAVCLVVNHAFADVLLYLQVYAVSGQSLAIGAFLVALYAIAWSLKFALFAKSMKGAIFVTFDLPGMHCTNINGLQLISGTRWTSIIPVPTYLILMALAFWIYRKKFHGLRSSLLIVLVRNGMIHVLVLLVDPSRSLVPLSLSLFLAALHPLLVTRMILQLREQAEKDSTLFHMSGRTYTNGRSEGQCSRIRFAAQDLSVASSRLDCGAVQTITTAGHSGA
ncbi:hypothetical protein CC2G_013745 [Coprinopsis cinerea AmutBmut pab1-1]|nr:hypothetical protein CC2G_013745 [Coprinopsis cinerea AmutBmut pab1-1]